MQFDSKVLKEGTQKNVIYVFNDGNADLPASYYSATIDSTSNRKPKKLLKQWAKNWSYCPSTPMTKENYSVNMPALGLATGTLFQGPNFEIRLYYQKNPLTKLYCLYLAIAQRK